MWDDGYQEQSAVRKYIVPLLSLAVGSFLIVLVLVWNARFTVASGEKTDDLGRDRYGYKVEQYYVRNAIKLTFWSSRGMEFVHEHSQLTIEDVVEQRWIKNDAAIYLNLQIKYHDSVVSTHPAKTIFDFHKGEVHVASSYTLWRIWDKRHDTKDWMSDSEFDAVLSRMAR